MSRLPTATGMVRIGSSEFASGTRTLVRDDSEERLEPRLAMLLGYLVERRGETVGREELLDEIWGHEGSDEALTQAISRLRRMLGAPDLIRTVPREGYRLVPQAEATAITATAVAGTTLGTTSARKFFFLGLGAGLAMVAVASFLLWPRALQVDAEFRMNEADGTESVFISCDGPKEDCQRERDAMQEK